MPDIDNHGPNADQIEFWNGDGGRKFIKYQNALDIMIGPFGDAAIEQLSVKRGEMILDVGCGCGSTTIDLARLVGSTGEAVGVDISEIMLARAEDVAAHAEVTNVFFEHADVETSPLHRDSFDAAFSRFGVMFFKNPVTAFANMARVLHEKGRIGFACWQPIDRNPWLSLQLQAVLPFVDPPEPQEPDAPGPFSLADPDRIRAVLKGGGFTSINISPFAPDIILGATHDLDDAVDFGLEMGPAGGLLEGADEATVAKAKAAVRDALAPHHGSDGVKVAAAAWIVTAQRA
ncbi:MAG: class I SAM-dependent methyltransferase [Alphaproteobacteria bacterium]